MNIFDRVSKQEANLYRIKLLALAHPDINALGEPIIVYGEKPMIRFILASEQAALKFCSNHRDGKWKWNHADADPREFQGVIDGVEIVIEARKTPKGFRPMFERVA